METLYHCTITRHKAEHGQPTTLHTLCLADLDAFWWSVQHPDDPERWLDLPKHCIVLGMLAEPPEALLTEAGDEPQCWHFDRAHGWSYHPKGK